MAIVIAQTFPTYRSRSQVLNLETAEDGLSLLQVLLRYKNQTRLLVSLFITTVPRYLLGGYYDG